MSRRYYETKFCHQVSDYYQVLFAGMSLQSEIASARLVEYRFMEVIPMRVFKRALALACVALLMQRYQELTKG